MTCRTPFTSHAETSEGKRHVIEQDQCVFLGYFQGSHPVDQCFTAEVHVGCRFDQMNSPALVFDFSLRREPLGGEPGFVFVSQLIQNKKADVVPGKLVFSSDVSQSCDKVFHAIYRFRSEEHTSELQSRENLVCRL